MVGTATGPPALHSLVLGNDLPLFAFFAIFAVNRGSSESVFPMAHPEELSMKCICGFNFVRAAVESPRPFENFALIDDKQYKKFLRAEMKANESKQLSDIVKATRFVGNLRICPECGVACISWPDAETTYSYLTAVTTETEPQSVEK